MNIPHEHLFILLFSCGTGTKGEQSEDTSTGSANEGIDSAENGCLHDLDCDGYLGQEHGGDDCDDTNPEQTPADSDQDGKSSGEGDCDDGDPEYLWASECLLQTSFLYIEAGTSSWEAASMLWGETRTKTSTK